MVHILDTCCGLTTDSRRPAGCGSDRPYRRVEWDRASIDEVRSPKLGAPDVVVAATEVTRVPECVQCDLGSDCAGFRRIVAEHDNARALVCVRQPAILVGNLGFAGAHTDRA